MKLLVAIHGIMTGQTAASWPDRMDAWFSRRDPQIAVLKKEYRAGPFPRWNCWVKDPRLAKAIVTEVELFAKPAKAGTPNGGQPEIWFVSHSNGAVIALLAIRALIARGWKVGGAIFTGAAIDGDVDNNGVLGLVLAAELGRAIAWCNTGDSVVDGAPSAKDGWLHRTRDFFWGKLMWPYGSLGRTGWTANGKIYSSERIVTRWCPAHWAHSGYWRAEHLEDSFAAVNKMMGEHDGKC